MEVDMPCHLGINVRFWNERMHCFHLRGEWKSSAYAAGNYVYYMYMTVLQSLGKCPSVPKKMSVHTYI